MNFSQLNLKKWILDYLNKKHFVGLTNVQENVIPHLLERKSMIIVSKTGSGKTLSYLIPILQNLSFDQKTECLIVVPTKELCLQIYQLLNEFKQYNNQLSFFSCAADLSHENQILKIKRIKPKIIIGTPTKIQDLLKEKIIDKDIKSIILDEADTLFDYGFVHVIDDIFNMIDNDKLQKIACSATIHESFSNKLKKYFKNTTVYSSTKSIWINDQIIHNVVYSFNDNHIETLKKFLSHINPFFCIIFTNSLKESENIYQQLKPLKLKMTLVNKNTSPRKRKSIFQNIQKNQYQYLITTDLFARGIDLPFVDVVISVGLPEDDTWYIHRSGRVGRVNNTGTSYVIYKKNIDFQLSRLTKKNISWNYLYIDKDNKLKNKKKYIKQYQKPLIDSKNNSKIKCLININKKIKPCYKKKLKEQIQKIKQKLKRQYIDKQYKKNNS